MLSDGKKSLILAEERYRAEVRSQLDQTISKSKSLMSFLNSAFGLWLISAIFISGGGTMLGKYIQNRTTESERVEKVEKLDLEIGFRLSRTLSLLADIRDNNGDKSQVLQIAKSLVQLDKSSNYYLYPEFSAMSVAALVAELRRIVTNPEEKNELDDLVADIGGIETFMFVEKVKSDPEAFANAILKELVLSRWTNTSYYYLACPVGMPFC